MKAAPVPIDHVADGVVVAHPGHGRCRGRQPRTGAIGELHLHVLGGGSQTGWVNAKPKCQQTLFLEHIHLKVGGAKKVEVRSSSLLDHLTVEWVFQDVDRLSDPVPGPTTGVLQSLMNQAAHLPLTGHDRTGLCAVRVRIGESDSKCQGRY